MQRDESEKHSSGTFCKQNVSRVKDLSKRIEFTQNTLKTFHVLFLIHTFHNLEDFFLFFTVILANLCLILYYIYRREKISKRYPSLKVKNSHSLFTLQAKCEAKNSPSLW